MGAVAYRSPLAGRRAVVEPASCVEPVLLGGTALLIRGGRESGAEDDGEFLQLHLLRHVRELGASRGVRVKSRGSPVLRMVRGIPTDR